MLDARCDELGGVGIYYDAKPSQVNDATDYAPWNLKPQCKTPDFRPVKAQPEGGQAEAPTGYILAGREVAIYPTPLIADSYGFFW